MEARGKAGTDIMMAAQVHVLAGSPLNLAHQVRHQIRHGFLSHATGMPVAYVHPHFHRLYRLWF